VPPSALPRDYATDRTRSVRSCLAGDRAKRATVPVPRGRAATDSARPERGYAGLLGGAGWTL
jgi:hypothetical protein